MEDPNLLKDIRFLRDVVTKTQAPATNGRWPVALAWGCIIVTGFLICALLGINGKTAIIPWVMPVLVFLIGWPLHWHLQRRARLSAEERGVRPQFRRDVMWIWLGIAGLGLLWTAALIASGILAGHWYVLTFAWSSLYFVGYVVNGVLLSREWLWAAAVLLASLIAAFIAGPGFYWLSGFGIGATLLMAGLIGRRNARLQHVHA